MYPYRLYEIQRCQDPQILYHSVLDNGYPEALYVFLQETVNVTQVISSVSVFHTNLPLQTIVVVKSPHVAIVETPIKCGSGQYSSERTSLDTIPCFSSTTFRFKVETVSNILDPVQLTGDTRKE